MTIMCINDIHMIVILICIMIHTLFTKYVDFIETVCYNYDEFFESEVKQHDVRKWKSRTKRNKSQIYENANEECGIGFSVWKSGTV